MNADKASGPRRAVLYARQSKYRHESESIPTQLEVCRRVAPELGLEVTVELVDKVSAYQKRGLDRPQWKTLLELVRSGEVEVVLVYKSERLSRGGGPGWAPFFEAAEEAKLDLDRVVATPSGYMSEFEIGLRASMDREEAKKIASRVSDVAERRARAGQANGGGRRAFGYVDARFSQVVPDEAELLGEARDRLLAGVSLGALARDWTERGLRTTAGNEWDGSNLGRTLRSPHLAGLRVYKGRSVPGNWAAIFTVEEHKAIRLAAGRRYPTKVPRHLLTGLLRCGGCGGNMRRKSTERVGGQYACQRRGCYKVAVLSAPIDELVSEAAVELLSRPLVRRALAELGRSKTSADLAGRLEDDRAALDQLAKDHYVERGENGRPLVSREVFLAASGALEERIAAAESSLASRRPTIDLPDDATKVRVLWAKAGLDWRRQVLAVLAESFTVMPAPGRTAGVFDPARVLAAWRY